MTSWREGGGRNLQPSSLTLGLPAEAEAKLTALGDSGTPPATSHPSSSTTGTTSSSFAAAPSPVPDPKEPSLRPAQPIRRTTVPTALQYQLHHTSNAVYHDMLPAFVSTVSLLCLKSFNEKSFQNNYALCRTNNVQRALMWKWFAFFHVLLKWPNQLHIYLSACKCPLLLHRVTLWHR